MCESHLIGSLGRQGNQQSATLALDRLKYLKSSFFNRVMISWITTSIYIRWGVSELRFLKSNVAQS